MDTIAEDVVSRRELSCDPFPFDPRFISLHVELTNVKGGRGRGKGSFETLCSLRARG